MKIDHQIGKTDAPMPPDEQRQHTDQSGSSLIRASAAKQAPVASTNSMTISGRANTLPEMPTVSGSLAMSTPKPVKSVKKKLEVMIEEVKREIGAEKAKMKANK